VAAGARHGPGRPKPRPVKLPKGPPRRVHRFAEQQDLEVVRVLLAATWFPSAGLDEQRGGGRRLCVVLELGCVIIGAAVLDEHGDVGVLPGLHYLRNGHVHELLAGDEMLRVGGVGGCFGPSNFERRSSTLQGYAKRHSTRDEIATLSARADLDIVLTHDAPAGVRFERHRRGEGFVSESAGLDELLAKTRPRVCFFGHHHTRLDAEVAGVRCLGLNKGHYPGCLVAFEMKPGERGWQLLGEWPPKEPRP
jgi:hypothetical protein